jgi:hypothetical protein
MPPLAPQHAGTALRETLLSGTGQAVCQSCHAILDPPGLAFETFDAIGRWRSTDDGAPVDVTGLYLYNVLTNDAPAAPAQFAGPIELSLALATSTRSQQCMARQWLAFVGGTTTAMIDDATLAPVFAAFQASNFDLQALIVAVLTSDTFLSP